MDDLFSAIRQPKVSEEIVKQIKDLILGGRLKPGERLPSERDLTRKLKVGRSSLREAINSLALMGLLDVQHRKGIYVRTVSSQLVSNPLSRLMENDRQTTAYLYDLRMDIEVAAAAAAAGHRSEGQLAGIRSHLQAMNSREEQNVYSSDTDLNFHIAIADATGNFLRVHIIKEIFDLTGGHLKSALAKIEADQNNLNTLFEQHTAIYSAIAEKDGALAGSAMYTHLNWVRDRLEIDP